MDYPINKLKIIIEEASNILKSAITRCEAISYSEQRELKHSINITERRFVNAIEEILRIIIAKET